MSDTLLGSPDLKPRTGDLYNIDAGLTEEERAIRDSVRAFVDEKVLPIIGQCYVDGRFPTELIAEMGAQGYFGANLPEEYGCAGLSNVAYGLINQELERGDSGIRSFSSVQGALVMYPIYAFGSEEQKRRYLPKMATGEVIGCFGLTEPDYGSNPAGMITRARQQKDGTWVLNGAKMWITNGSLSQVGVVWAKTHGHEGVHHQGDEGEAVAARLDDERAGLRRCASPGRRDPPQLEGTEEPADVPDAGALRHRLGGDGGGHRLL
jgi:glutaryl-CoA dehydrogenase